MNTLSAALVCAALLVAPAFVSASARTDEGEGAETVDARENPFAQFDVAVTSVVDGREDSEGWTPLVQSGVQLVLVLDEVARGRSVDQLIENRGVRADVYSRSLVQILNPDIASLDQIEAGETVAMFRVEGSFRGASRIALLPYQASRLEARQSFEAVQVSLARARYQFTGRDFSALQTRLAQLSATYEDYFSASPESNAEAARVLSRFQDRISSALREPNNGLAQFITYETDAANRDLRDTTSRELTSPDDGRYSIAVSLALNGQLATANPGLCRLGWAVNGLERRRPKYHDLPPVPRVVRSHASPLQFWVERDGRIISTPREAPFSADQVIAGEAVRVTLREPCT